MVKNREIDKNEVGQKINRQRNDLGLSVKQLAAKTNLDSDWLLQLEGGEIELPVKGDTLFRVAEALETTIADLYGLPIRVRISETERSRE